MILSMIFTGCITGNIVSIPPEEMPANQEQFDAEVNLYASELRIVPASARVQLYKIYPQFADPEETGQHFGPVPRIMFDICEESDDGKDPYRDGSLHVTYEFKGKRHKAKFMDSCYDKKAIEYYCTPEGRFGRAVFDCSCWDNSCK